MSFYGYRPADYRTDLSTFSRAVDRFGSALAMVPEINKERTDMLSNANYMKETYDDLKNAGEYISNVDDVLLQYARMQGVHDSDLKNDEVREQLRMSFLEEYNNSLVTPEAYDRRGRGVDLTQHQKPDETQSRLRRSGNVFATGDMNKAYTSRSAESMANFLNPYRQTLIDGGHLSAIATAAANKLDYTKDEYTNASDNMEWRQMDDTIKDVANSFLGENISIENLPTWEKIESQLDDSKVNPRNKERFRQEHEKRYASAVQSTVIKTVQEKQQQITQEAFSHDNIFKILSNPVYGYGLIGKMINTYEEELRNNPNISGNPALLTFVNTEIQSMKNDNINMIKYFTNQSQQSASGMARSGGGGSSSRAPSLGYIDSQIRAAEKTFEDLKRSEDPQDKSRLREIRSFISNLQTMQDDIKNTNGMYSEEAIQKISQAAFTDVVRGIEKDASSGNIGRREIGNSTQYIASLNDRLRRNTGHEFGFRLNEDGQPVIVRGMHEEYPINFQITDKTFQRFFGNDREAPEQQVIEKRQAQNERGTFNNFPSQTNVNLAERSQMLHQMSGHRP